MRSNPIDLQIVREAAGDLSLDHHGPKLQPRGRQVAKPQTPRLAGLGTVSSSTPFVSRRMGKLFQQRVFQTSTLALLLLSLAIYLGTRAGAWTFLPTDSSDLSSTTARTSSDQHSAASGELPPIDPPANDGQQHSSKVFTYVVQPDDTLRALCLSVVGRYDQSVQKEIRELNPNLKDLTHLNPGEEIRLPLLASKPDQPQR